MSINKVFISGNLTHDPEEKSTAGGTGVMTFSVAVNDRRKNQQTGEWEDYANYVDVTMFGTRIPYFMERLSKGAKVFVEGKLRWSQWEKDGQKRSRLDVIADEIELMPKAAKQAASEPYADADLPF